MTMHNDQAIAVVTL